MIVLVSGSHGLIGSAVAAALQERGDTVHRLVRGPAQRDGDVSWDPAGDRIDRAALAGHDAVVHLAGEPIFGRWTAAKKQRIRDSRVLGTQLLARELAALQAPPRVLVSGSAVGWYGDRGDEVLTEDSEPGSGSFLTDVARDWEVAAELARSDRTRVVRIRTGIVQSDRGGALKTQLLPFRLGLGGRVGSGRQWTSWISIDDVVRVFLRALDDESLDGAVNAVAPEPVTNAEYTKVLGRVLGRPTVMTVPAPLLKAALGELSSEALSSLRVAPTRLEAAGFEWQYPQLEPALRHVLGRSG